MKPTWQERLNYMSDERVQEALRQREAYIKAKEKPVIKLKETSYRCVEAKTYGKHEGKGYFLQSKWLQENEEWIDVTDLTEMKVWEYNDLVSKLHNHYPDYPIEHLEGRFV